MSRLLCYILPLVVVLAVGCTTDPHVAEQISHAESIYLDMPDSAQKILSTISNREISTKSLRARHALLLTYCNDKCYIDTTSDSLIRVAVDFYESRHDRRHLMVAQYLLGRVYFESNEYSRAMFEFLKTEDLAKREQNHLYLGLSYRAMADIFDRSYNGVDALEYGKLAHKHFALHGNNVYTDWALADLGRLYHNANEYTQAIKILSDVMAMAQESGNTVLYVEATRNIASSYFAIDSLNTCIELYERVLEIRPAGMHSNDYMLLGSAYATTGNISKAEECIGNIENNLENQHLLYNIYQAKKEYKKALEHLVQSFDRHTELYKALITESSSNTALTHFRNKAELNKERLKHLYLYIAIIVVVLCAIIVICIITIRYRHKLLQQEIEENMAMVVELQNRLMSNEGLLHDQQTVIGQLFSSHYDTFNRLSSAYYECHGMQNEKQKIHNEVVGLINSIATDGKAIKEMESFVDRYKDNVMTKFGEAFPNLDNSDKRLFMYLVLGFSSRAISIFMNEKIEVVYNRKSRLKQKISRSDSQYKEMFTSLIN